MNKEEFLSALRKSLLKAKVSKSEVEKSLAFYGEAIDDYIEAGMDEESAVGKLGSINTITSCVVADIPPVPRAVAKAGTGSKALNIVLLVIGSPIWMSIGLALAACAFSVYVSLWAIIISLWACVLTFFLCAPAGIIGSVLGFMQNIPESALFLLGSGLAVCGLGIFSFLGARIASIQMVEVTRHFARWVAHFFKKNTTRDFKSKKVSGQIPNIDTPKRNALKYALIVATVLIVIGGLVVAAGLYMVDWNFLSLRAIKVGSSGLILFHTGG